MLSSNFLFFPIVLQMLVVGFDEVYYHNRREISRPEQIGHALDTLTVWVCFALILLVPPSSWATLLFTSLSIFSCLFITKDEFEYHKSCVAGERWLHGLAFLLHPLSFISAGLLWPALYPAPIQSPSSLRSIELINYGGGERYFLLTSALLLFLFGVYEVIPRELIWGAPAKQFDREEVAFDL